MSMRCLTQAELSALPTGARIDLGNEIGRKAYDGSWAPDGDHGPNDYVEDNDVVGATLLDLGHPSTARLCPTCRTRGVSTHVIGGPECDTLRAERAAKRRDDW